MIRKSSLIGLFGGLVIGIAVLYPMITLAGPGLTPQWVRPVQSEIVHTLLLMLSALIGAPFVLSLGVMAARKSEARGWQNGMKMGALAGVFASILSYLIWLLPLNALMAYSGSLKHIVKMDAAMEKIAQAVSKQNAPAVNENIGFIERVKTMKRFTKYGEERWLLSTYTPYYDVKGEITKILYFAYDITETKNYTEKLEDKIRELENEMQKLSENNNPT